MAKSPSSKYASNRALTCSVPAEIIDNLGFPYGAVFTMTGKLEKWGVYSDVYVRNPSTFDGNARVVISSRYPIYLETASGVETKSVVEGNEIVSREFQYLEYYPCTFVDHNVSDPTDGNVLYYAYGYNRYNRGECNFRHRQVDDRTGEVYCDYTEKISSSYPFRLGDNEWSWTGLNPYDRVVEGASNEGVRFHEVYDGNSLKTDAIEYKQAWNDWRSFSELGLNKSSYNCTWQFTSGTNNDHGLQSDVMAYNVDMYGETVYEPSNYSFGYFSPFCVSGYPTLFSTEYAFKTVNRHETGSSTYTFKQRDYTCKVALSGNTPSFGSRQAWIEYCKTLYD